MHVYLEPPPAARTALATKLNCLSAVPGSAELHALEETNSAQCTAGVMRPGTSPARVLQTCVCRKRNHACPKCTLDTNPQPAKGGAAENVVLGGRTLRACTRGRITHKRRVYNCKLANLRPSAGAVARAARLYI